jgi:hypothetical protein
MLPNRLGSTVVVMLLTRHLIIALIISFILAIQTTHAENF